MNAMMGLMGRFTFLVDENAHAVHFFISALLQLLDRAGSLYGFVLRLLLGRGRRARKALPPGAGDPAAAGAALLGPAGPMSALGSGAGGQLALPAPAATAGGAPWAPPAMPGSSRLGLGGGGGVGQWDGLWSS
jgi:peroxin-13